jgi:2,3-bisphosphoglycerate-independent phosphoglycerate mutase
MPQNIDSFSPMFEISTFCFLSFQVLRGLSSYQGCDSTSSERGGPYQGEERQQEFIETIFKV